MPLRIRGLEVAYGRILAVKGVDLDMSPGEIVALVGSNGAGKTTFLSALSGLKAARRGNVTLDGEDLTRLPAWDRVKRGVLHVPEGRRLFPGLTTAENLELGAYRTPRSRSKAQRDFVLDLFPELRPLLRRPAGLLSGGEQQMAAIGRGLMGVPTYLMLDEPSLGLAPKLVTRVLDSVLGIAGQGIGVLLVEQNAKQALTRAERAYVLDRGHVSTTGSGANLLADPTVQLSYLGGAAAMNRTDARRNAR